MNSDCSSGFFIFLWNLIIFNWWVKSIWNIWSLPIGQVIIIDNTWSYPIVCQVKIFDYIWSYTIGHVKIFDNVWSYPIVCQVKIPIFGFPAGRLFQPHGFDISNRWRWKCHNLNQTLICLNFISVSRTDYVYVISHNGDHSSVEIFNIRYR